MRQNYVLRLDDNDVGQLLDGLVARANTSASVATLHASRSAQRTDLAVPDRLNFGGWHVVGHRCPPTGLTMQLVGFNAATGKITDANGEIALVSDRSAAL